MFKKDIQVIALDIYGTVLCINDADNIMPPRRGIDEFFNTCHANHIKVCACSDSEPTNVKIDLKESGISPDNFDYFFHLNQLPRKDFSLVAKHYKVKPRQILVLGDNYNKDIMGAIEHRCLFIRVPEYRKRLDDFDFRRILLE